MKDKDQAREEPEYRQTDSGRPLHFHYDRSERLSATSAASLKTIPEQMRSGRRRHRRRLALFYLPIVVVVLMVLVVIRNQKPAYEHYLDGYSLALKTQTSGDLVYASLVILKVGGTSLAPGTELQAVFSTLQGEASPVLTRRLPTSEREVEVVNTAFTAQDVREVIVRVTVGAESLSITQEVGPGSP